MKWRTYSVFVSSTFADMQAERDYLQSHVFPLINEELRRDCISLRVIDLRFGINTLETSEESVEEKVLRVCIDEINRSHPFFLGLLGNRYGTTPLESKLPRMAQQYKGQSITAIEIMHGFLQREDIHGCLFMERDSACYEQIPAETRATYDDSINPAKSLEWKKLQSLKQKIKSRLAAKQRQSCYHEYSTKWNGLFMTALEDFGNIVKESILNEIHSHFTAEHNDAPFVDEKRSQEEFLHLHRERRYPRHQLINDLSEKIESGTGLIALTGVAGTGKSSLYTALVDRFLQCGDMIVLYHATDTGQENRSVDHMLARWIYQLEQCLRVNHQDTSDAEARVTYFRALLKKVPEGKKIVLLIDAVEGFFQTSAAKYLTFYPKSRIPGCCLFCTCLPETADAIAEFHHSMLRCEMPPLRQEEAEGIINKFATFEDKELYPQNIDTLLSIRSEKGFCYESALWLLIALQYATRLNQRDFTAASILADLYEGSFDKGLIAFIDQEIRQFPDNEEHLFTDYLHRITDAYGSLPRLLFRYLSASYNGLDEDVLKELLGDDWDPRTFAIIRSFLRGFITEQSQMKSWQLMHRKVRIPLTAAEKADLCGHIASIYLHKLYAKQTVTDNLFYYLFYSNDTLNAFHYVFSNKWYASRVKEELIGVSEIIGAEELLTFLFATYDPRHKGIRKLMPAWVAMIRVKDCVMDLANAACKRGDYQKTVLLIDKFHAFLFDAQIPYDIKLLNYMLTVEIKLEATERIYPDSQQMEEYRRAIGQMKIRGPISLLLAPIAKWYYNWQITKIK